MSKTFISPPHVRQAQTFAAPSSVEAPKAAPRPLRKHWLRRAVPNLLIAGLLVGVGYWGHRSDWSLPKFSALVAGNASAVGEQCTPGEDGWCKEHNVPEAICIECNTKLLPAEADYGWCAEHGIAQCPLHHPEIAQLKATPVVTAEDLNRANRTLALLPRGENNSHCKHYQRRIQFASIDAIEKAGIDIAIVDQKPLIETVTANGEIVYDETHTAHLASRVPGTVWRVEKKVGDSVRKGDILALVDSAEIGRAKSEMLQAIATCRVKQFDVDRLRPLAKQGAVPGKQLQEAEAALQESQIKLLATKQSLVNLGLPVKTDDFASLSVEQIEQQIHFLGLPAKMTNGLDENSTTSNLFPLRAPLDGVVVDCKIVAGEIVDISSLLFVVTDLRQMWLLLDVRQDDARYLSQGQSVLFHPTEAKDEPEIRGTVSWISTAADDKTRTVKVRCDLPNPTGQLRANTFGLGRIVLRTEPQAVVVPTEAVHSDGDCNIVFVRDKNFFDETAPKFFHVREVRLGVRDGNTTEIIAGVLPGEVVASKNSVVLEAQLLKSNLGEGCACCAAAKK
jgi:cobalt-zinc-cadmium efflux system membrane fusion protein